ncbi:hypothetical protein RHOSPDRAFT_27286, partial [Rhodotorula sp. JG-1b]
AAEDEPIREPRSAPRYNKLQPAIGSGRAAVRKSGPRDGEVGEASSGDEGSVHGASGDNDDDGSHEEEEARAKKARSKGKTRLTAGKSQKSAKATSAGAKPPKGRVTSETKLMRNDVPDGGNAATSTD